MLDALLTPRSIAVIGASRTKGRVGYALVANLIESGFEGPIVPINPSAQEILGRPCYPSIKDCPTPIDLAVIAVPTAAVKEAVRDSLNAGVRGIIVITAGFKETGHEGAQLEAEIARMCRD